MKLASSVLLFASMMVTGASANTDLFHIKRNKNHNEFHYEARITVDCQWQDPATLGQWYMLEEGPDRRENIAIWEGGAYGHEDVRISSTRIEVTLNAKEDLPVSVDLIENNGTCEVIPTTRINGKSARLRFIYVCARERLLMFPKIQYVDVHGFDSEGNAVVERFPRTKWARNLGDAAPLDSSVDPPMGTPHCGHGTD